MIFISSGVFICETLEVLKDGSDESKNIKDIHLNLNKWSFHYIQKSR